MLGAMSIVLQACSGHTAIKDSYFKCTGSVVLQNASVPAVKQDQEIAAHFSGEKVLFSGNSRLGDGKGVQVCPSGTLGTSPDEYYFDSDSCSGKTSGKDRIYGTFNRITHSLHLSQEQHISNVWLVAGAFACKPAKVE